MFRVRSSSHTQSVTTPTKDHWLRLLRMRSNVFSGLQLVQIINGPDKQGPDNRGCTVVIARVLGIYGSKQTSPRVKPEDKVCLRGHKSLATCAITRLYLV